MVAAQILGVVLALSSALVYGSADFFGGLATRKYHAFAVLALTTAVGTTSMAVLAFLFQESWPAPYSFIWGSLAGAAGVLGLILIYYGLAKGNAAIVSPIAGVIGASLPVIFTALRNGIPPLIQITGFILAVPGIFLVTQTHPQHLDSEGKVETIGLLSRKPVQDALIGSLAGLFFGLFFICLSQIKSGDIFGPLAVSKLTSFLIGIILILIFRVELAGIRNNPATIWVGILAGFLDVFANALYLLATRLTRLDVAVVLTSLYPVGTVFLSYLLLKERINRLQWAGVWLCLLAIMLIAS